MLVCGRWKVGGGQGVSQSPGHRPSLATSLKGNGPRSPRPSSLMLPGFWQNK